jgi:hypothetical protein|tara:strand:- start:1908 stop:2567 length:660 start_codon:yes stop_codon:yes gene_type:complete
MKLDPTGRLDGDFYDEFDNLIGSDGIDDGKVYVINTSETEFENGNDVIKGKGQSLEVSNEAMNFVSNNNGDSQAFENNSNVYDCFTELPGSSELRNDAMDYADLNCDLETATISVSPVNDPSYQHTNQDVGKETSSGAEVKVLGMQLVNDPGYIINLDFHSHNAVKSNGVRLSQPPSQNDINNALENGNSVVYGLGSKQVYLHNNEGVNAVVHPNTFRR